MTMTQALAEILKAFASLTAVAFFIIATFDAVAFVGPFAFGSFVDAVSVVRHKLFDLQLVK